MRRGRLRRRVFARLQALRRAIFAPPGNAVGRMAWRCRRAGVAGPRLDILGDAILARLQDGIIRVGHDVRAAEPAPPPAAAIEVPAYAMPAFENPADDMPALEMPAPESVGEAPAVEVPAMAARAAAPEAEPGAVIYPWQPGPDSGDGRLLSLRAWLDYMHERGRLSPHEWTRLYELGRAPGGIQYLIRLRDYYDGSGPYPGDALAASPLRTGNAA